MSMNQVVIYETHIRRDDEGRYCLNDLHRAAGGKKRHQPAFFMRRQETKALAAEIGASAESQTPIRTINDGRNNGTYAAKELVYAYAMWISAAFALKVIRTYDALMQAQLDKLNTLSARRARAELELAEAAAEASRCGLGATLSWAPEAGGDARFASCRIDRATRALLLESRCPQTRTSAGSTSLSGP